MKLLMTRTLGVIALIGLYALNPLVGAAGLVAGFGFLVWHRTPAFRTLYSSSDPAGD